MKKNSEEKDSVHLILEDSCQISEILQFQRYLLNHCLICGLVFLYNLWNIPAYNLQSYFTLGLVRGRVIRGTFSSVHSKDSEGLEETRPHCKLQQIILTNLPRATLPLAQVSDQDQGLSRNSPNRPLSSPSPWGAKNQCQFEYFHPLSHIILLLQVPLCPLRDSLTLTPPNPPYL